MLLLTNTTPSFGLNTVTFGNQFDRQRCNNDPILPPSEPVWFNDKIGQSITQPVMVGNKIFHASDRWLWELPLTDGSDGQEKRLFEIDTGETETTGSHPTYLDNVIYVGSKNGNLYAYDLAKRSIVAHKKVSGDYGVVSSPLAIKDDMGKISVIAGSSDGQALYIFEDFLNPAVTKRIECNPGGNITSSPSQLSPQLFVFATNYSGQNRSGSICFYDLAQEKIVWTHATDNGIPSSVAVTGNLAYAIDKTGQMYCLDFQQKRLKWSDSAYTSAGTFANFSPALADGKVFFPIRRTTMAGAKGNGILTAYDQVTGLKLWATKGIKGEITTSPVVWSAAGLVLVGTSEGYIYGFDIDTGQAKGWYTTDGGNTISAVGQLAGVGSGNIHGNIRPDGITTEFAIANGYLLVGGVRQNGQGLLCAFKLIGSDVALTSLQTDNPNPTPGEKIDFQITVRNLGENPRDIAVRLTDNRTRFEQTIMLKGVPGMQSVSSYVYGWSMPSGQVKVTAKIISPAGGSKFNYLTSNDSLSQSFQAGVDLAISNLSSTNPVFTGDSLQGTVTVTNNSGANISTAIKFLLNNNPKSIPSQNIQLKPFANTQVLFPWTAPSTAGSVTLKATVNPDHDQPIETDYANNTTQAIIQVKNQEIVTTGGRLTVSATPKPSKTKAGYGFELAVYTETEPYTHQETHTRVVNNVIETYTDTHHDPCPGARDVTAYFPNGVSVKLEPVNPLSTPANTWRLPPDEQSHEQLRKHYIPSNTPDGDYQVKIVASGAGKNNNLTAQTAVIVIVDGSLYDDIQTRITE